ncbi:UDP-N-acetylmuramoyl-tripeptide--D-alanyl-D-alanine ligase [Algibacillus agarilyticus]|uniref:UDP-N-acetylmuramoyl-tripeptide--D-alanyl-D- alanine ligase n=1 Tax=Algibacillus agarilyticus TaxID=2234133 RepID=UPI000DCFA850|nr:UDP-N-acetylmuramoyl-tripeptide--D-alanyl-D-alanine ligase [Algibacillus agarilyticus]
MIKMSLQEICELCKGQFIGLDTPIEQVSTDTREIKSGSLFIALRGDRFDAHAFIEQAIEQGASAVVVDHVLELDIPQVVVDDTRVALGLIAKGVKALSKAVTIAITGSCGKTTVKELLGSICAQAGQTLMTQGNLNNDIGVPLTLLNLTLEHEYAVVELGANHIGEISYTVDLVQPDVALVNNVSAAHLEGFGSLNGVAQAKGEIYGGLAPDKVAVINLDCPYITRWHGRLEKVNTLSFALQHRSADVSAADIRFNASGYAEFNLVHKSKAYPITLSLPGQHNIQNALAAATCAIAAGIAIESVVVGLNRDVTVQGRLNRIEISPTLVAIDDTYNANSASMKAALDVLAQTGGRKIFVMGDMAELGNYARKEHQMVGDYARSIGISELFTLGELSLHAHTGHTHRHHYHELDHLMVALHAELTAEPTTILVKGSRSAKMERVIEELKILGVNEC